MGWKQPTLPGAGRVIVQRLCSLYQKFDTSGKYYVAHGRQWVVTHQQNLFLTAGIGLAAVLFFVNVTAGAAVTAAWVALLRHYAAVEADRQRRITESFSGAVEQLASDKLDTRLGGIYTLERIAHESSAEYPNVTKLLCAFIRTNAHRAVPQKPSPESPESPEFDLEAEILRIGQTFVISGMPEPRADIAAALWAVSRGRRVPWRLDLRNTDLNGANLVGADLRGAILIGVDLNSAFLHAADLRGAILTNAVAWDVRFERADLREANLTGADLHSSWFDAANLAGAILKGADLGWADLSKAYGLSQEQLAVANGTLETRLPDGMPYPPHWSKTKSG